MSGSTAIGRRHEQHTPAIAFLASDAASDITGTVLNVDGVWLAYGGTEPPPD